MDFRTWWLITVGADRFETDTLLLSELEDAEEITGIGWTEMSPLNVKALQGLVYAFLRRSMPPEHAKARLAALRAADVTVELIARPNE